MEINNTVHHSCIILFAKYVNDIYAFITDNSVLSIWTNAIYTPGKVHRITTANGETKMIFNDLNVRDNDIGI